MNRKIKRFAVAKRVTANQSRKDGGDAELPSEKPLTEDEIAWLDQAEVQRGLKTIRENARTAPPTMRPTLNLELDLGLDSMQRVELLSRLEEEDRKSTRLNSSHLVISYAVFCLKKKT